MTDGSTSNRQRTGLLSRFHSTLIRTGPSIVLTSCRSGSIPPARIIILGDGSCATRCENERPDCVA
jgi:hypothetical protein